MAGKLDLQQAWIVRLRDLLGQAQQRRAEAGDPPDDATAARHAAHRAALKAALQRLQAQADALLRADPRRAAPWAALEAAVTAPLAGPGDPAAAEEALRQAGRQLNAWSDELTPDQRALQEQAQAEQARQAVEAAALGDELEDLVRQFAAHGPDSDALAAFKAAEAGVRAALKAGDLAGARGALRALPPLVRAAEAALAARGAQGRERQRRIDVLALLQRRVQAESALAQQAISRRLRLKNPSKDHNDLDTELYGLRQKAAGQVDALQRALEAPLDAFELQRKAALAAIAALAARAKVVERPLLKGEVADGVAVVKLLKKTELADVAETELPRLRAAVERRQDAANALALAGRADQTLRQIQEMQGLLAQLEAYRAARDTGRRRMEALEAEAAVLLPHQRDDLHRLWTQALARCDEQLAAGIGLDGAFDAWQQEAAAAEAFVRRRKRHDAAAGAARQGWQALAAQADAVMQAALATRVQALPGPDELDPGTIDALADAAEVLRDDIAAAAKLTAAYEAAMKAWAGVPSACTGPLAPAAKALAEQLAGVKAGAPGRGYAVTLDRLPAEAAEPARAALLQASTTLAKGLPRCGDGPMRKQLEASAGELVDQLRLDDPRSFQAALERAQALATLATQSNEFDKQLVARSGRLDALGLPKPMRQPLDTLLAEIKAERLKDPAAASKRLAAELDPRLDAAGEIKRARAELGKTFNDLLERAPATLKQRLLERRTQVEALAVPGTVEALRQCSAALAGLLELVPAVDASLRAGARVAALHARAAGLAPRGDAEAARADANLAREAQAQADAVASSVVAAEHRAAAQALDRLAEATEAVCKSRQAAARQGVKNALKDQPALAAVVDELCARKAVNAEGTKGLGGEAGFEALLSSFPPAELARLLQGLDQGRQPLPGEAPAARTSANADTLLRLAREMAPAELASLTGGLGGADAVGVLLHQGFKGSAADLAELARAYPGPAAQKDLKQLLDEGFGGAANMATVISLGCPTVKKLKDLAAEFDPATLRALMDQGLGSAEALGQMLRTGCKSDPKRLAALAATFDNTQLATLCTSGCGDAANLAGLLGDACNGDAASLAALTDGFTADPADLPQLLELVTHLGGKGAGRKIRTLVDRHFAGDLSKVKDTFYDGIAGGAPPATPAQREQLIRSAPDFEGAPASDTALKVTLDSSKFDKARVAHFLERHVPRHFIVGDKLNKQGVPVSNIKPQNTQWSASLSMDTLQNILAAAIAATKNDPGLDEAARKLMPAGSLLSFDRVLPAYGVEVRISYKKAKSGDKVNVDQFFPLGKAGTGTVQDVQCQEFDESQMKRLKAAFGK